MAVNGTHKLLKGAFNTTEHQMHCRKTAEEGIVLLKNSKNILPLDRNRIRSIAVIGANASQKHAGGGGSSYIKAKYEITPLDGLRKKAGARIILNIAQGYSFSDSADTKKRSINPHEVRGCFNVATNIT